MHDFVHAYPVSSIAYVVLFWWGVVYCVDSDHKREWPEGVLIGMFSTLIASVVGSLVLVMPVLTIEFVFHMAMSS